jgi:hypothetical protein
MENLKHIEFPNASDIVSSHHQTMNEYRSVDMSKIDQTKMIYIAQTPTLKKESIQKQKRIITTTNQWQFSEAELQSTNQYDLLYDTAKSHFLNQQIKNKLSSYRCQDIEKGLFDKPNFADLSGVLQKMRTCQLKCFYCKEIVILLYENVREPKQWTLERINNKIGHTIDNVEIACLNLQLVEVFTAINIYNI